MTDRPPRSNWAVAFLMFAIVTLLAALLAKLQLIAETSRLSDHSDGYYLLSSLLSDLILPAILFAIAAALQYLADIKWLLARRGRHDDA